MMKGKITIATLLVATNSLAATEKVVWGDLDSNQSLNLKFGKSQQLQDTRSNYELKEVHESGKNHKRFQIYYKDLPVFGYQLIIHSQSKGPQITGLNVTDIEKELKSLDGAISKEEAINVATKDLKTSPKLRQLQKLVYLDQDKKAHLAYKISLYVEDNEKPINAPNYIIDANSGEILKKWDDARSEKIGQGLGGNSIQLPYRGGMFQYGEALPNLPSLEKFDVKEVNNTCFVESEAVRVINMHQNYHNFPQIMFPISVQDELERGYYAYSYPCNTSTQYLNYADGENGPVNYSFSPINDTMYFAQKTYEMYRDRYGVKKPLGDDLPIRAYTHIGQYDNAFAIPTITDSDGAILAHQQIAIGNGDTMATALTQSVLGHELSHNFTEVNSGLIYDGQTGGINEAFSDMAAIALMDYIRRDHPWYWDGEDWSLAREVVFGGQPIRYFDDPTKDGRSIGHADDYEENMNVHLSSGVFNKAFYLLATKPGWDVRAAFQVMVDANQNYWSPLAYFNFAACGVIQAAVDRDLSADDVIDAFSEVGVYCPLYSNNENEVDNNNNYEDNNYNENNNNDIFVNNNEENDVINNDNENVASNDSNQNYPENYDNNSGYNNYDDNENNAYA